MNNLFINEEILTSIDRMPHRTSTEVQ